jgi:hypothetical protein
MRRNEAKRAFALLCTVALMLATVLAPAPAFASPGLVVADLNSGVTPQDVIETLLGTGVAVDVPSISYTGDPSALATFTGGTGIIGFESGVIMSTGDAAGVVGPNDQGQYTVAHGLPGDADLTALSGYETFDACVLEFDFVPDGDMVFVEYVFASDEYNEYANTAYNDTFAFFVNGVNYATVGDPPVPVSVNTVNTGNPVGDPTPHNPELFVDNPDTAPVLDTQMDGLTVVLVFEAPVNPGVTNHMKLAIADGSDSVLDADVFVRAESLSTEDPEEPGRWAGDVRSYGYWKNDGISENDSLDVGDFEYEFAKPKKGNWKQIFVNQAIAFHNNWVSNPVTETIPFQDTHFDSAGMFPDYDGMSTAEIHDIVMGQLAINPATWDDRDGVLLLKDVLDLMNNKMYLWF